MITENEIVESEELNIDLIILDRLAKWFRSMSLSDDLFVDCLEFLANGYSKKALEINKS